MTLGSLWPSIRDTARTFAPELRSASDLLFPARGGGYLKRPSYDSTGWFNRAVERHVDLKKLGKIPVGGGWRMVGRSAGRRNWRADKSSGRRSKHGDPLHGHHFLHTALDGHSRLAYSELLSDERKETAAAFWRRANAWFSECGIIVGKVLTDNGSCYRSHAFKDALAGLEHRRTRPYRPQTNGKVERFHRTLADEWAYARIYTSDTERCDQFPIWLHTYNHHRGHTALGGQPPASRVPNLSGQYN